MTFQPKVVTKKILKDLKDRSRYVITKRFGLEDNEKRTLESIGKEYSITRERVRQIENFALGVIRKSEAFEEANAVFEELKSVIEKLGSVVSEEDFLEMISPDPIVQNQIQFYLVLNPDFILYKETNKFKSRWTIDASVLEKIEEILSDVQAKIIEDDLLEEEELFELIANHDHMKSLPENHRDEEAIKRYISISNALGKNPLGDWGLNSSSSVRVRGVRDYAFLVMRRNGSLMHFKEVAEAIEKTFDKKTHIATTHNELIKDKRFVLVGRGIYGLLDWGYHTGVVRDVIRDVLKQTGPLTKEDLISQVLKERYLKKNTIMVNLQNPDEFYRDANGLYHIVEKEMPKSR